MIVLPGDKSLSLVCLEALLSSLRLYNLPAEKRERWKKAFASSSRPPSPPLKAKKGIIALVLSAC